MSKKTELVGSRIKVTRIENHMSQRQVAAKIGISQAHMSNIECGRSHCTLENLLKLSEVYNCPVRIFFADVDKEFDDKKDAQGMFSIVDLAQALLSLKK